MRGEPPDQACGALRIRITNGGMCGERNSAPNFCRAALDGPPRAAVPTQIVTRRSGHADAAAFPQLHYLVEHAVRNFPLRGLGNLDHFAVRNNRDRVAVRIKTNSLARNVIDYDCIE